METAHLTPADITHLRSKHPYLSEVDFGHRRISVESDLTMFCMVHGDSSEEARFLVQLLETITERSILSLSKKDFSNPVTRARVVEAMEAGILEATELEQAEFVECPNDYERWYHKKAPDGKHPWGDDVVFAARALCNESSYMLWTSYNEILVKTKEALEENLLSMLETQSASAYVLDAATTMFDQQIRWWKNRIHRMQHPIQP